VAELNETLESIERKTRLLIARLARLESDNAALLDQNQKLTTENRALQTDLLLRDSEISHLKTQGKVTQELPKNGKANVRTQQIRKEIDQYITEVDSCIEWLQKS
jgi:predicted  nucleic acid-binding Zn-ribbon protein